MNSLFKNKGLLIFLTILLIIQIFYYFIYFFISGIYYQYGYNISDLTLGLLLLSVIILHGLILLYLILMFFGYQNKKLWMRKFTMFYLLWGIVFGIWGIIVSNNIIIHIFLILFYIIGFYYLTTDTVKKYFEKIFLYGKYILYSRYVKLKSGRELPIFFFSSHIPKSGSPSKLPEGYIVEKNPRSNMPYLKKTNNKHTNKKSKTEKNGKKLNVIYVVNKTQPGNRGNWAVKSKNKILSSHRTKKTAINNARKIAKKLASRVLVQNSNGRFSYGFNPND